MELEALLDKQKLVEYLAAGLVSEQTSLEDSKMKIYNYTHLAMQSGTWDDVTMQCRGLIVRDGKVLARGFRKFFNINTQQFPETLIENLPLTAPEITEKYDGSLGILYTNAYGHTRIATRGSFDGDIAKWATSYYRTNLHFCTWPEGYTPLFEIICPLTKMVVDYRYTGMVLLGFVNLETGAELPTGGVHDWAGFNEIKCRETYPAMKLEDAVREERDNHEGYVLTWHLAPDKPPLKVKVKHEEYVQLHRVLSGISSKGIWELLSAGCDLKPLQDPKLPDSLKTFVSGCEISFKGRFAERVKGAGELLAKCPFLISYYKTATAEHKKNIALWLQHQTQGREYLLPIAFSMLAGKNTSEMVWKQLRPEKNVLFRRNGAVE